MFKDTKKVKDVKLNRGLKKKIQKINEEYNKIKDVSRDEFTVINKEFRDKYIEGYDVKNDEKYINTHLYKAFALVKQAIKLELGMELYDVQLAGGYYLAHGDISEMKTGEGKTLTSVLPVYMNAVSGRSVHVVTTNSYLSERDAKQLMGVYKLLGLSVGINKERQSPDYKKEVYKKDIIYSTHSELAFDYLRDNMKFFYHDRANQRGMNFVLVDECDSVLIDEARTPLIITGLVEGNKTDYELINNLVKGMKTDKHFDYDNKTNNVTLTEYGVEYVEDKMNIDNLYGTEGVDILNKVMLGLRAHNTLTKGKDYLVREGEVKLLDKSTGRVMQGKQYSDGLHQYVEIKEGLKTSDETKINGKITYQNYFRLYDKSGGMSGTAKTDEEEFIEVYNMKVYRIPTNAPIQRIDYNDKIFVTRREKYDYIVEVIKEYHEKGNPVLIGTTSVNNSEEISEILKIKGLEHDVLNAKNHYRESEIIMNSGQYKSITVATNMAGRGTDIKLGEGVKELGGLVVIGTDRHESRRVDNQLIGRSGRQGDPGVSMFVLSLEDELVSRFVPDSTFDRLKKLKLDDGQQLNFGFIRKSIVSAQKRLEGNNFDSRKDVLKFDNVLDHHRRIIYGMRDDLQLNKDLDVNGFLYNIYDYGALEDEEGNITFDTELTIPDNLTVREDEEFVNYMSDKLTEQFGGNRFEDTFRYILLSEIDNYWEGHLEDMNRMLDGVHLKSYAQEDPHRWYQNTAKEVFEKMVKSIEYDAYNRIMNYGEVDFKY